MDKELPRKIILTSSEDKKWLEIGALRKLKSIGYLNNVHEVYKEGKLIDLDEYIKGW